MDEQWRAEVAHDPRRFLGPPRPVGGDPGIARLAAANGAVERAHGLRERGVGGKSMRVEDVDVLEAHAREALIEARQEVLARAPLAVRAGPHVVAGLRGDDELVAPRPDVLREDATTIG